MSAPTVAIEQLNPAAQQQKLKATFTDDQNRTIHIDYNGPQHLFRIRFGAMQRLFFFDELSQKLILRNEYGVVIGQLSAAVTSGWVRLDDKRYGFTISEKEGKLSLLHPKSGVVSTVSVTDELIAGILNERYKQNLMYCLIFAFAWTLN